MASGLADRMLDQLAPETFAVPRRVNGYVVDEVRVGFGPGDQVTVDRARPPDHHDAPRTGFGWEVGDHRRGLAADPRNVFGVSGPRDRGDPRGVSGYGLADDRHEGLTRSILLWFDAGLARGVLPVAQLFCDERAQLAK